MKPNPKFKMHFFDVTPFCIKSKICLLISFLSNDCSSLFYRGTKWLLNWQNFRRFYLYIMTENMKNIILKHRHILLSEETRQRHNLNEREIIAAATLPELDEAYTRRVHNFPTTTDLYRWSSSLHYFDTIEKPMIFINAKDDPLVPEDLLPPIKSFAGKFLLSTVFL